jgi:hypothetical protein
VKSVVVFVLSPLCALVSFVQFAEKNPWYPCLQQAGVQSVLSKTSVAIANSFFLEISVIRGFPEIRGFNNSQKDLVK